MEKQWMNKVLYFIQDRKWMSKVTTSLAVINGAAFLIFGLMVNKGAKEMNKLADTITPQIIHDTLTIIEERKPECPICGLELDIKDGEVFRHCGKKWIMTGKEIYHLKEASAVRREEKQIGETEW